MIGEVGLTLVPCRVRQNHVIIHSAYCVIHSIPYIVSNAVANFFDVHLTNNGYKNVVLLIFTTGLSSLFVVLTNVTAHVNVS
jgi:hypothetical protein